MLENYWDVTLFLFGFKGEYFIFTHLSVGDESDLGSYDKIKTSNFMICQSEIVLLN